MDSRDSNSQSNIIDLEIYCEWGYPLKQQNVLIEVREYRVRIHHCRAKEETITQRENSKHKSYFCHNCKEFLENLLLENLPKRKKGGHINDINDFLLYKPLEIIPGCSLRIHAYPCTSEGVSVVNTIMREHCCLCNMQSQTRRRQHRQRASCNRSDMPDYSTECSRDGVVTMRESRQRGPYSRRDYVSKSDLRVGQSPSPTFQSVPQTHPERSYEHNLKQAPVILSEELYLSGVRRRDDSPNHRARQSKSCKIM